MFETPLNGRPWYKRMTIVWGAVTAAGLSLEGSGVLPEGTVNAAGDVVASGYAAFIDVGTKVTGFLTLIGVYRQVNNG